jgi:hypothetical protein
VARDLTAGQLRALIAEYGTPEALAQARPELADTLRAVQDASKRLAADLAQANESLRSALPALPDPEPIEPYVPEARQVELLEEIAAAQRGDAAPTRKGGRPEGSYIETERFWVVWKMAVDGHSSARAIERATRENHGLELVDRNKAGVIVRWVEAHRRAAKAALVSGKPPRGFRDTPYGVRLPKA